MPAENNPDGFDALTELALDLRWSWNHASDGIWRALDPTLWHLTRHPYTVFKTISRDALKQRLADPAFRARVDEFVQLRRAESAAPAWFQEKQPEASLSTVAYFSMEFMLSEALPIYSGGLGNVAGDLSAPLDARQILWQR